MKKFLPYFTIIFCLFFVLQSCRKDDSGIKLSLPAKTQSGENTFGFLYNLDVWTNYGQVCFPFESGCRDNLKGTFYTNDGEILINADRVLKYDEKPDATGSIELILKTNFRGTANYNTATGDTISFGYIYKTTSNFDSMYILPVTNPIFNITITKLDTVNKILSGEFSGKIFKRINYTDYTTSLTDSINVTDGRFDIKLVTVH